MSQSDYIKYKKTSNELLSLSKYPSVLGSQDYTSFMEYNLENSLINTKQLLNQITLNGKQIIFNMELKTAGSCPSFSCLNGQTRNNRVLNSINAPVPTKKYVKNADANINPKTSCPCSSS